MTATDAGVRHRLRPGAHVIAASPDLVQVCFPNYTATFTGLPVVAAVTGLLDRFACGAERAVAVEAVAQEAQLPPQFVDHLVDALGNAQCLHPELPAGLVPQTEQGTLAEFYASIGDEPVATLDRLAAASVVVFAPAHDIAMLTALTETAGLRVRPEPVPAGEPVATALERLAHSSDLAGAVLACWGFPYRFALPRKLNELVLSRGVPVLYGGCEGVAGRVGPYVVPGTGACLECVVSRLLSHAGEPELRAVAELRARSEERVPPRWPAHPSFVAAVAGMFVLELARIAARDAPTVTGAILEYTMTGEAQRHPVLRAPRCPACTAHRPRRLAWDARLAAATGGADR